MQEALLQNSPLLWKHYMPFPTREGHKYSRGSAIINGGTIAMTGAARLAAMAALRAGAGVITLVVPPEALPVYAAVLLAVMVRPVENRGEFEACINDPRCTALLLGPGNGVTERTRSFTLAALATRKPCVVDADALTVFSPDPSLLFSALHESVVLTPHAGEFARLFPSTQDKVADARHAAKQSGAIMVLKGADTVIAHPDGRVVINSNAPPYLATAGSGDVLAGIITGLLACGVAAFHAACMGVWLHGEAANRLGLGMISEDLPGMLPSVLQNL